MGEEPPGQTALLYARAAGLGQRAFGKARETVPTQSNRELNRPLGELAHDDDRLARLPDTLRPKIAKKGS